MTTPSDESQTEGMTSRVERLDTRLSDFIDREEKRKHWKDTVIPILSLLVALAGIIATTVVQVVNLHAQARLKQYEVTFIAKQKTYAEVLASLHELFFSSTPQYPREAFIRAIDKLQFHTFSIQPFLPISEQDTLWEEIQQFIQLCYQQRQQTPTGEARDEAVKLFTQQRDNIRQRLNRNLFSGVTQ
jgi:hypothetical protein